MKRDPKQIAKVLADIHAQVPKEWRDNVVETVKKTPTIEMVVNEAIDKGLVKPELVEKLKVLRDSGQFSQTKQVDNPKYAKLIDQFVTRRINQAIKKGLLPPKLKAKK